MANEASVRVLSLFDGMACGALALLAAEIEIDRYVAYEIDKYAVKTSSHNFPFIEHKGDVFKGDFTEYKGFDLLCGGSPCTYWSIAQKNNRETEASGMGWELFQQYVRALREAEPKFFIYENNKSMSKAIRASITETFGFEPVLINSALVSAQNRQRLYWVGKRNADGTYSNVDVEQPEDRGILLRDILDAGQAWRDKSLCVDANYYKGGNLSNLEKQSGQRLMVAEPVNTTADGKAQTIRASCYKDGIRNMVGNSVDRRTCVASPVRVGCMPSPDGEIKNSQGMRVYSVDGKSVNQTARSGGLGRGTGLYAVPCYVGEIPENNGTCKNGKQPSQQYRVYDTNGKGVAVTTCAITNVAIPCGTRQTDKSRTLTASYSMSSQRDFVEDIRTDGQLGKTGCIDYFAEPIEWNEQGEPIKAISGVDGKTYTVYKVDDKQITIKGKQYPMKLADGYYIIRKLTVRECMRLQTVPEWYEFPVSDSQAYKLLGNGWTVEVVAHISKSIRRCGYGK